MLNTKISSPPITFNDLLRKAGYDLEKVRLLRHQDPRAGKGRSVYELWRDDRPAFDRYQSQQSLQAHRSFINSTHWASFVGTPDGETMFVGFYRVQFVGPSTQDDVSPTTGEVLPAGSISHFNVMLDQFLQEYVGRLFVDWGDSKRTWIQLANKQEKPIIEIKRRYSDPAFPGYLHFINNLSRIPTLPSSWIEMLKAARGIYVLTCPKKKELYIGSAYGADGFYGRWMEYARTGHGGNVQLKSREPSDYQVSILEVAGSAQTSDDVLALESHWKDKLQTRERGFGLNSN